MKECSFAIGVGSLSWSRAGYPKRVAEAKLRSMDCSQKTNSA